MKKMKFVVFAWLGLFLFLSPAAWGTPMFARMYGYNCDMCHYPGYGELNQFGYAFLTAGYRLPTDIGKDMNSGNFDIAKYMCLRFSDGINVTSKSAPNMPVSDASSFTMGNASFYLGGALSTNFFAYNQLSMGNGTGVFPGTSPSLQTANIGYVTGNADNFFTLRLGKFSTNGYAGSDASPLGNDKICSIVCPTGTGMEFGYTHADTRVTLAFYDGIQDAQTTELIGSNGKPVTTTTLEAPTSSDTNAKDIQLFVNQFLGGGAAINFVFYNGFEYGTSSSEGKEYYNAAIFLNTPNIGKFLVKAGGLVGQNNAGIFAQSGVLGYTTGGFFGEVDYEMDDITPLVCRYDYTTTNFNAPNSETQIFTLGAVTPFVEHVWMNPEYTLTLTQASLGYTYVNTFTDSLNLFF